jgi:hypothetical protein
MRMLLVLVVGVSLVGGELAAADPQTLSKPTVSGPAAWTQSSSAELTFTSPDTGSAFSCRLDGSDWAPCVSPVEYAAVPEGHHSFGVRAVAGDASSTPSNWSWTVDQTPPSLPGDRTVEATSPLGTVVSYAAQDNLDPWPTLTCSPDSGSAFSLGATVVSCSAHDAAGNAAAPGSFQVTVRDTTAPQLSPHGDVIVTQDSAAGATVAYELPAVSDAGDASPAVRCSPASGSTFAVGTTQVECSAEDAAGNLSAALHFGVIVQQGASPSPPALAWDVVSPTRETSASFTFHGDAGDSLACKLEGAGGAGAFQPCTSPQTYTGLADGSYLFTVRATNGLGNVSDSARAWIVDTTPPAAPRGVSTAFGAGWIGIAWRKNTEIDLSGYGLWRRRAGRSRWVRIATSPRETSVRDGTVRNDVRYVYAVRSVDRAGNRSTATKVAVRASRILRPAYGAVRSTAPLIDWTNVGKATYYNLQVWHEGRKVLSVWPSSSSYHLTAHWRYGGRLRSLAPGRYLVYVWPGYGGKAAADYGKLLGWTAFRIG